MLKSWNENNLYLEGKTRKILIMWEIMYSFELRIARKDFSTSSQNTAEYKPVVIARFSPTLV